MAWGEKDRAEHERVVGTTGMQMLDAFGPILDMFEGLVEHAKGRGWSDAQARAIVVAFNCSVPGAARRPRCRA